MDADCIVSENDEKVFAMVFVSCIIILQLYFLIQQMIFTEKYAAH